MDSNDNRREIDATADIIRRVYRQSSQPADLEVGSVHLWEDTGTNERWLLVKDRSGTIYKLGPMNTTGTVVGSGAGAPATASYVTIGADGVLTAERRLTAGTAMILTDGGANSTVTLSFNPAVSLTISSIWTFSNYTYYDTSGNQIQSHSDGAGNYVIERNGAAGTLALGNSGADLDTTVYGDLSITKTLTVGDDITGTGGTTINGGTAASNGLALESTTNATKGGIFLASGTSAPVYTHGASSPYADMVLGSSLALKRTAISSNTTLDITHCIVEVDCGGGNVTVTLPSASGKNGRVYFIRRIDNSGNTLTIAAASGSVNQLGAAASSYTVAALQQTKLYADGTSAWYEF